MTKQIIIVFAILCSLQARADVVPARGDTVRCTSFHAAITNGCTPELLSEAKLLIVSLHFKLDCKVTELFSDII